VYNVGYCEGGSMLNRIMTHVRDLRAWAANPVALIDRFLDHLDTLSRFVLPAPADNPAYRTIEVDARRRRLRD
jgi:hypothetical protein